MIHARNVVCGYSKREVVHGVSLSARPGCLTGLLGPNGSGKTTLLSVLAGVLPVMEGDVIIDGRPVGALSARERASKIAVVPQKAVSAFALKCGSIVLMGRFHRLGLLGIYRQEDHRAAEAAMQEAGVLHLWERPADEVSGGEFQRVLFARALAQGTRALLLDEPSAAMDMAGTVQLFDKVKTMTCSGKTALVAVHDINLAALYCDELVFMKEGQCVAAGPTQEVFNETVLSETYGADIRVTEHPVTGSPQALVVPGSMAGASSGDSHGGNRSGGRTRDDGPA